MQMGRMGFRWFLALMFGFFGYALAQSSFVLPGTLGFEYQRLNNCGPVTTQMLLSLYGVRVTQASAAKALKGSYRDRNVTTPEMAAYLGQQGLRTVRRWGITAALARDLLRAGFPVILHQTQTVTSDIGHFRVAYGFDVGGIITGDSMFGPRVRFTDADFARVSRPFNGEFLIAYRPAQSDDIERVLGEDWSRTQNLQRLLARNEAQVRAAPNDGFAWWGLGQARLYLGQPQVAARAFDQAVRAGLPKKQFWYQHDAFAAWNQAGHYRTTDRVAATALKGYPNSTEINLAHATALDGLGRHTAATLARRAASTEDPRIKIMRTSAAQ